MKRIPLTQGKITFVDDCDYEYLMNLESLYASFEGVWYACTRIKTKQVKIHRLIMERINPGFKGLIDHIDGNGLNNQRNNLRIATQSQNLANRGPQENNTSGYKGVYWDKERLKWVAIIEYQGTKSHLGRFDSEIEAAITYDIAAIRLFGEFARTNFPKENYRDIKPYGS